MGERLDRLAPHKAFDPTDNDLAFVRPTAYQDFLLTISNVEKKRRILLNEPLAVLLRCVGAVDRSSFDNKHIVMKTVSISGETKFVCLGFAESEKKGAASLSDAIKKPATLLDMPKMTFFGRFHLYAQT